MTWKPLSNAAQAEEMVRLVSEALPPRGELRGGAWVVVDPTINPDMMELYADETSRGGILEPEVRARACVLVRVGVCLKGCAPSL